MARRFEPRDAHDEQDQHGASSNDPWRVFQAGPPLQSAAAGRRAVVRPKVAAGGSSCDLIVDRRRALVNQSSRIPGAELPAGTSRAAKGHRLANGAGSGGEKFGPGKGRVEASGIEPPTSALRTLRSPS